MVRLQGNLKDIFGVAVNNCAISVQLCGFGTLLPRVAGTAVLARTAPLNIDSTDGTYDFNLYGNDAITPAGTYYSVTILDDRHNVVQANAFRFTGATEYDLADTAPYDPSYTPPPVTIRGGLILMPWSADLTFDAGVIRPSGIITFEIPLDGNVLSSELLRVAPGQIVTFIFKQTAAAATFVWPVNVYGADAPSLVDATTSIQTFVADSLGILRPLAPMTVGL